MPVPGRSLRRARLLGLAVLAACAPEPPNVLLVSVDMLRADHLGCYGYARATSPAIDRLAAEGVLFEQHIASSSWTLPSHASLFTSVPDDLHGAVEWNRALGTCNPTLAERFAAEEYATAGFFSGPYLHPAFGLGRGFERYVDCTSYAGDLDGKPVAEWAMDAGVMKASHADVTGPRVLEAFTRWLEERDAGRPFFAFVHLWDVHFDFTPPPPYDTRFDPDYEGPIDGRDFWFDPAIRADMPARDLEHLIALYDGEIAWTDSILERIRGELERRGLLETTIVAITSDHGTEFFEHGDKGHRKTLYDEVVHVPLVLRHPSLTAGQRVTRQTRAIDVGPTLLELAGLPEPRDALGRSLMPIVRGEELLVERRAVSELMSVGRNLRSVRTPEWKFLDVLGADEPAYFDLRADPGEQTRLADRTTELWRRSSEGYLNEVGTMQAFGTLHPPCPVEARAPRTTIDQLMRSGYVGEDEAHPPPDVAPGATPLGDYPADQPRR